MIVRGVDLRREGGLGFDWGAASSVLTAAGDIYGKSVAAKTEQNVAASNARIAQYQAQAAEAAARADAQIRAANSRPAAGSSKTLLYVGGAAVALLLVVMMLRGRR